MSASSQNHPEKRTTDYRAGPCPICAKMSLSAHHPFCSVRCRDIDLHRWLGGHYALPAEDDDATLPAAINTANEDPSRGGG